MPRFLSSLLALFALSSWVEASGDQALITEDQLAFYRLRSFAAPGAEARLPINHLGIEGEWTSDGGYRITAALESYPAHEAELRRGDVIETMNGEAFHPVFSLNPALRRGASEAVAAWSEPVTLGYRRGEQGFETRVTPVFETLFDSYRTATANSVLRLAAGNKIIGYVRLWALSRSTGDLLQLKQLVAALADTDGIVLDLRNSAGYLHSLHIDLFRASRSDYLQIASMSADTQPSVQHLLLTEPRDSELGAYRRPVAILIDSSTRGSAALLAHQLGKLARITTVGTTTSAQFGFYELGRDALEGTSPNKESQKNATREEAIAQAYRYVPADELLVDGIMLEGRGVEPERANDYPFAQTSRVDPQFQLAVDILMGVI